MKFLIAIASMFVCDAAFSSVKMRTQTESKVTVTLLGTSVTAVSAPIKMDGGHGRKAVLDRGLRLDLDCETLGLVVQRYTDGDALVAYCHVDSGPTTTFVANLAPPSCREGTLTRDHRGYYICRVRLANCSYDRNPYTWEELAVQPDDNNHGCQ